MSVVHYHDVVSPPIAAPIPPAPLRVTITTTAPNETFTLPLTSVGTVNFDIDWGDGSSDTITVFNQTEVTHTFVNAGTYVMLLTGQATQFYFGNAGTSKDLVTQVGGGSAFTKDRLDFFGCSQLATVDSDLDFTGITTILSVFRLTPSLLSVPPELTFPNGTGFVNTFRNAAMATVPLYDTSAFTAFDNAFYDSAMTSLPDFDTSNVANFRGALRQAQVTTLPNWDFSSATTCSQFAFISQLTNVAAGTFDTTLCTNFTQGFSFAQLTQQSVDNILADLVTAGQSGGTLALEGGGNAAPSAAGAANVVILQGRGWTVTTV